MARTQISLERARSRISTLWFLSSGAILLLLFLQSFAGIFEAETANGSAVSFTKEAWSWITPLLAPTLGLIVGNIVADRNTEKSQETVRLSFYRWMLWLSVFYLTPIALTVVVQVFYQGNPAKGIELMRTSSFLLALVQGLVIPVLAVAFAKKPDR